MTNMANYWTEKGWEITLFTFVGEEEKPAYPLHERVNLTQLGIWEHGKKVQPGIDVFKKLWRLRKALWDSHPDCVISFMDKVNVAVLAATRGLGIPVIVSERTNPWKFPIEPLWTRLRRWTYPFADALVVPSRRIAENLRPWLENRVVHIPNAVYNWDESRIPCTKRDTAHTLITAGRLEYEKAYDILVHAFSLVAAKHPLWELRILGEGKLRPTLEKQIGELGLNGRVHLEGWVDDPYRYFRASRIFVLSSRFEGFPNVLFEAMACGIPAIAFACDYGPDEIVRHDVDGILVPPENVDALAEAMDRLMSDEQERRRLAERAPEVLERFSPEKVMDMWENLINRCMA